jgi:hypothetical protein
MPIKIPIETTFDPKGTSAAAKALEQVAQAKAKMLQADSQAAASISKVAQAQNAASISAVKLGQAQSQAAVSAAKLTIEQTRIGTAASQAAIAEARAEKAALSLAQAQEKAAQGSKSLGSSLSTLVQAAGSLGVAFGAQQIIQGGIALTQTGAQALQTAGRFDQLSAAAGQSGDALLKALRSASGGQISDLNLQLAANRANLLGVATSAEQLATLMEIARDRAQSLGTTATEAFNDLVTGLGRGSPMILDNLGIMVDIKGANEAYAASVGKTVSQLSEAEKKQALINQVVSDGKAKLEETGGAADTAAGKFAALGVAAENAATKIGSGLATILTPAAEGATALIDMAASGENLNSTLSQLVGALAQYESAGLSSGDAAQQAASQFLTFVGVTNEATPALTEATSGGKAWGEALFSSGAAAAAAAGATRGMTTETDAATAAISSQLTATIDAEAKTRALTEAQDLIARLGGAVAAGFGTSQSAAAAYAIQLGITTAQAELLIAAQARLAGGNARLAGQAANTRTLATPGFNAPGRSGKGDADILATVTAAQKDNAKAADETAAAQRRLNEARGGSKAVLAGLRSDLAKATVGSADYINTLAKIETAEKSAAKAGGGRAASAKTETDKLVAIEQSAADKIIAINQRLADAQAAAARKLASDISSSTSDMIADQEANDLDLIGAKEENMDRLRAREEAEGNARIAQAAAVSEAQARAAAGDAETASAVLDIREASIAKQQALDEEYARRRAELAGSPEELAALKQQYDEATQAAADAAATRVALAESEASQKKAKAEEEKQAAISAASDAAAALEGTGKSAATARGKVDEMIARLAAIPTEVTTTINVKTTGSGAGSSADSAAASSSSGGSASVASAGGGTFMTSGPTHFTVGDNPGGREIVSVIPVGAAGKTSTSGNVMHMAGGGVVDVNSAANEAQRRLAEANERARALAGQLPRAVSGRSGGGGGGGSSAASENDVVSAIEKAISVLDKIADLREKLANTGPPLDMATITTLVTESKLVFAMVRESLIPINEDTAKAIGFSTKAIEDAIGALSSAASLRDDAAAVMKSPLDMATLNNLVIESRLILTMVRDSLVPTTERQATEVQRYADAASSSIGLLADVSKLTAQSFADYKPPTAAQINRFAKDAEMVVKSIAKAASSYSSEGLTAAKAYSEALGGTFTALTGGLTFIEALNTGDYAIDMAKLTRFTKDSMMLLDKTHAIGAKAATIPAGNIAAINAAAGALSAYGDSMIKIAAVPDIQSMAGYAGGGGSSTNMGGVNIIINAPMGIDVNALAQAVILKLNNAVGARR